MMQIKILYDWRPSEPKFPYSGLQILGYNFAKALREQGHRVTEGNIFGDNVIPQEVEAVVGIGFWGDMLYLKRYDYKKLVAYMVTDGRIPPQYRDIINKFSKTLVTSNICKDIALRDGLENVEVLYPGIDLELFKPDLKLRTDYVTWLFLHGGDRQILEAIPLVLDKLPNAHFLSKIHYSVTKEHFTWVKPLVSELGIEKNVTFLDALIMYDQMPKFYNQSYIHLNVGGIIGFEFPCFPPETNIWTEKGLKFISDIKESDVVLTHKGLRCKVNQTYRREYCGEMITIRPFNCLPIKCTPEHPILAFKRPKKTFGKGIEWAEQQPIWIKSEGLEEGDCVVFPKFRGVYSDIVFDLKDFDSNLLTDGEFVWYKMGISGKTGKLVKTKRYIPLCEELCYLLGWYIGEGSTNSKTYRSIDFSFSSKEGGVVKKVGESIYNLFGLKAHTRYQNDNNSALGLVISGTIISKFFSGLCGCGAKNKRIPKEVLYNQNLVYLERLLDSLYNADGCYVKDKRRMRSMRRNLSTASFQLANDVFVALIRLGIKPRICKNNRFYKERVFPKKTYLNTEFTQYFVEYILDSHGIRHSNKSWFLKKFEGIAFLINKIEKDNYNGLIYNLEVEEDNSYITTSFAVHNCVESMACQTPVISMNSGTAPELIKDGYNGYLIGVDERETKTEVKAGLQVNETYTYPKPQELANRIIDLLENPKLAKKMGENGRKTVEEKFDIKKQAKKMVELIG